jgi:hypothetical protein
VIADDAVEWLRNNGKNGAIDEPAVYALAKLAGMVTLTIHLQP